MKKPILVVIFILLTLLQVNAITDSSDINQKTESVDNELIMNAQRALRTQFYENMGQAPDDIFYYGSIPGGTIGFARSKIILNLQGSCELVELAFLDSCDVAPKGVSEINSETNYFLGERGTFKGVSSYSSVVYENLWKGIDLVYRATEAGAKYEFIVTPGANPNDIVIQVSNHESIQIEETSVRIYKGNGIFIDEGLKVYQDDSLIEASFKECIADTFSINLGAYDKMKTLVVDPLVYSTYVQSSDEEQGQAIVLDDQGNAYVTGTAHSNFPTVNAYDDTYNDNMDCFVFKLNSTGNGLVYSTYVGGGGVEQVTDIAIDPSYNVYVTGSTTSNDFPASNSHNGGINDGFVFKLNGAGNDLVYSRFIGGNTLDTVYAIALDGGNNAFLTGRTTSTDFPTVNAMNSTNNGGWDVFVMKVNSTGTGYNFSTYIGGGGNDEGLGIAVDSTGNAYVTGKVGHGSFPTINAFDDVYQGETDCFVLKLNSTGNGLMYSTFVGGSLTDYGNDLTIDEDGNAYVAGFTQSSNFVPGGEVGYDHSLAGGNDGFTFKLNATGNGMEYMTHIGGAGYEEARAIVLDSSNRACVGGFTSSSDFPKVNSYDDTHNENEDCFLVRFNAAGTQLNFSTYVGGGNDETILGLAVDDSDVLYATGWSTVGAFPMFNAYDSTPSIPGDFDCFVFAMDIDADDTIGPEFEIRQDPESAWDYQSVNVYAYITDASQIEEAKLSYSDDNQATWTNVTMTFYNFEWYETIPQYNAEDIIYYKVYAKDSFDNWAVSSVFSYMVQGGSGPTIINVERDPTYPLWTDDVNVTAYVTDYSGVAEVTLRYSIDYQTTWTNVTMVDTGGGYYSGIIPQQSGGTTVYYQIFARDNIGFWNSISTNSYDVTSDDDPPSINSIEWESQYDPIYPYEDITVRVEVYDPFGIDEVTLSFSNDDGFSWENITMVHDYDDWYEGDIPGQPAYTYLLFKILVRDTSGNWAESTEESYYVESDEPYQPTGPPWQLILSAVFIPTVLCLSVLCICRRRRKTRRRPEYPPEPVYYETLPEVTPVAETPVAPKTVPVEKKVAALRGCQAVGGQFEYKVKIKNDTNSVITNVNVTIVAFPSDCMEIVGPTSKTISRIEPDGFRSPQFIFSPTKDCVEGRIQASVTYIDYQDKPHTIHVEPYTIRSVCDLLKPLETTMDEFDLMLFDMETTTDERMMDWNPQVLFSKAEKLLPARNFHILDQKSDVKDGMFRGMIRGLAEGKYTGKKVAVRIHITGNAEGHQSKVIVEGLGDDIAMLPTTIEELEDGIDSWICLNCGGALDTDEVTKISSRAPVECRYCGHTLTIALYKK